MATPTSQRGRGRIPAPVADDDTPVRIVSDIRAGAPFLLSRAQLLVAARRLASITALVCVDLGGLVLGLYAALVARELYYGREPVLWGVLWRIETDWLPFLTLVTVLVFSQSHLYEERERRPGFARVSMRKRRAVQNHIGTVHAIAMCNLAEMAAGTLTEISIPASMRWLPKGMQVEYLKKAETDVEAHATVGAVTEGTSQDVPVTVEVRNRARETVVRAVITMWVTPRKKS